MVPGVNVGQDSNSRVAKRDSADERGYIVFLFPVIVRRWLENDDLIFLVFFFFLGKEEAKECVWELFGYPLKGNGSSDFEKWQ